MSALKRQLPFVVALVIIGGSGLLLNAQLPQAVGTWAEGGQVTSRIGSAAVSLPDGRTLIVAGHSADIATTEVLVYDPASGTTTVAGNLAAARTEHAAVLLKDGRVLVAGGVVNGEASADLEIFDPTTGTSAVTATMLEARRGLAAARLSDKSVLLIGGSSTAGVVLSSTERFDPETGSIAPSGALAVPRREASATTLHDGRVVVAGGSDGTADLRSAEIYTPYADTFTTLESELSSTRRGHIALLLPNNGSLMIAGGIGNGEPTAAVDLYLPSEFPDPYSYSTSQFSSAAAMAATRVQGIAGAAALEGHIFVSGGGSAAAETYRFPTIRTDKDDYAPGQRAVITGTGWQADEVVTLRFQEDPAVHDDYVLTVTADGEGRIYWDEWAPEKHDLGVRFYLIARGELSHRVAQTTFTDGQPRITNVTNAIISPEQPSSAGAFDTTVITARNQGGGNLTGFEIRIRNTSGSLVRTFLIGNVNSNTDAPPVPWNGRDAGNGPLPDGNYTVLGFANGAGENDDANDVKTVTIDNTNPTATLTSPADNATVPGTFDLEVSPVDSGGNDQNIQRVDFYIDGNLAGSDDNNSSGWRLSVSPIDGAHTWFVRVFDKAGNNVQSSTRSFTVDSVRPSVTITQAVGQTDPTGASPIRFAATFSESVTGFTNTDVALTGTAGATTVVVTGGPASYVVEVSGMITGGTVIISIPANAAQDAAGNTSLASTNIDNTVTFVTDNTPPVIVPNVSGILGNNNWYTSNVKVTWTVTDAQSSITNTTGCGETNLTTDTAGITYTCTATSAGGTASQSVTVKRDASAPNAPNGIGTPAANGAGWNNTDVTVTFQAAGDIGPSGIASCSASSSLTAETPGTTISGTCTDNAGNQSAATNVLVKIDKTVPVIAGSRSPLANAAGWNNTDVVVSFTCSDTGAVASGIATNTVAGATVSTEGTGQSVTSTGACVDAAGNAAPAASVGDINIDQTNPVITGQRDPAANTFGWNNTDVTVSFTCADPGTVSSGLATNTVAGTTVTNETSGLSVTNTGNCVDTAGNAADSSSVSDIRIDKTAPAAPTGSRAPLANGAGWNNQSPVTVSFVSQGDLGSVQSGIDECTTSEDVTGETAGTSVVGTCRDRAGNVSTNTTVVVKIDLTKPVITGLRSPLANLNGWNNTDVTVSFTCNDPGPVTSGLATNSVAGTTVTTEVDGLSVMNTGSCVDTAGNAADSSTVSDIRIDKTAPAAPTGARSPEANAAGWNNQSPVAVSFMAQGDLGSVQSGVDACTASTTVTGETLGMSVGGTCRDRAGNESLETSVLVKIDLTKPVITGQRSPLANPHGWNNTNVNVSFACADYGSVQSGIETNNVAGATVSSEGENQSVTNSGACVDFAGNSATAATVGNINIDKTAPNISGNLDKAPAATGWFNLATGAPTAQFTCSDPLSGIATGPCPYANGPLGEGAAQSVSHTVTDKAGNSASATVSGINVDLTKPTITVTSPANPSYALNAVVNAAYSCNGGVSGLASCNGPVANGSAFNTASVGGKTFAVSAMDVAGNTHTDQVGYNVVYATGACLGSASRQMLEPVNADYSSVFKQKSTVPAKFRVCDANGVSIGTPGVVASFVLTSVTMQDQDLPVTELIVSTTPDTAFRWSASDQQWIFNLSTKNLGVGKKYTYTVTLNDGTSFGFGFTLK